VENFDLDAWWLEKVGPYENVMDKVYKEITEEAIIDALKFYNIKIDSLKKMEEEAININELDLDSFV
jgi:hypothetical protein